jgi:hypothetical protein
MKKKLGSVTLLGIDCLNIDRLVLAAEICQEHFEFADVKLLTSLPAGQHKNIVHIEPIIRVEDYSQFVISRLDEFVDTEHVLVIQYDGFILNPHAWDDSFLKYDYIGAPWLVKNWSVRDYGFPSDSLGTMIVGNGGFSLRSKKFLSICAQLACENKFDKYHPEDVALCVWNRGLMERQGIQFAPVDLGQKFSFEGDNYESSQWNGQFGFHGLTWTDISKWNAFHPEYKIDIDKNTIDKI